MDLRIEKTKRSIINSFLEVRSKKEIEKVTVKEICEKAQINKSTFYSHYHDIYDLSDQLETEVVDSIIEQMSHPEYVIEKPELFTQELTEGYMSKNTLINILFSGSRSHTLVHKIEKSLKELVFRKHPEYKNDAAKNITLTYSIYGGFYAFLESRQKSKQKANKKQIKKGRVRSMKNITTKQFQLLSDNQIVWDLLAGSYAENGVAAPFFEYAIISTWFDKRYLYLDRLWFDGDKAVGFVFYEAPCTDVYFSLRHGYEELADELIEYAEKYMPGNNGEKSLIFNPEQKALMEAAGKRGYGQNFVNENYVIDFGAAALNHPLPDGFHFVDPDHVDPVKLAACTWKGFDHEDKDPFENWDAEDPGTSWNPQKAYLGIISDVMSPPPHSTYEYDVIIADEKEEYACFSGMWWVPENKLAYMEPLCTIPEYRHMGLAAAALSKHYGRMKELGAECMTGGGNDFYRRIGYNRKAQSFGWKKHETGRIV